MTDILKSIKDELPLRIVSDAIFEGANIVLYTKDKEFFKGERRQLKKLLIRLRSE